MKIVQQKRSNKHTFTFNDEQFNFAYEDKTGSGDVDMDYADFPRKSSVRIEQNEWLRNVGYLWCAIGTIQLGVAIYAGAPLAGKGFWLLLGFGCLAWERLSRVKYSVFQAQKGSVFVIQDKRHDEIISELNARKKSQLLKWYGEIDLENGIQNEINKFRWLCEQQALTKEEADIRIAQIQAAQSENIRPPSERLN